MFMASARILLDGWRDVTLESVDVCLVCSRVDDGVEGLKIWVKKLKGLLTGLKISPRVGPNDPP